MSASTAARVCFYDVLGVRFRHCLDVDNGRVAKRCVHPRLVPSEELLHFSTTVFHLWSAPCYVRCYNEESTGSGMMSLERTSGDHLYN